MVKINSMISAITSEKTWLALLATFTLLLMTGYAHAHGGSLNAEALDVCKDKERSQVCQYEGHHNDLYIGTCQYASEDTLICVRNKPIQMIAPKGG